MLFFLAPCVLTSNVTNLLVLISAKRYVCNSFSLFVELLNFFRASSSSYHTRYRCSYNLFSSCFAEEAVSSLHEVRANTRVVSWHRQILVVVFANTSFLIRPLVPQTIIFFGSRQLLPQSETCSPAEPTKNIGS